MIHNAYISTYPPVDEWEALKKPMKVKGDKYTEIRVYYLDESSRRAEKKRLYDKLQLEETAIFYPESEWEMEQTAAALREKLTLDFQNKQKELERVFRYGKPYVTYLLLAINVLFFFLLEMNGGSTNSTTLINFGAKYNPAILSGEWWRIIASMFLHIGLLHLMMNMLALFYVGSLVEKMYGSVRYTFIYFLAGIIGGLASFAFNTQVAAGASGALFGLFGALLYFGLIYKKIFFQTMGWNVITVILLNIVFSLMVPQIDNGAHFGGLAGGFLAAAFVSLPEKKKLWSQSIAFFAYCVAVFVLIYSGIHGSFTSSDSLLQLQLASQAVEQEEWQQTLDITTAALQEPGSYEAELLFFRSVAYLNKGQPEEAILDLEKTIALKPDFAEAYHNLAILYADQGRFDEAAEAAAKAHRLAPENAEIEKLYQRLQGDGER